MNERATPMTSGGGRGSGVQVDAVVVRIAMAENLRSSWQREALGRALSRRGGRWWPHRQQAAQWELGDVRT